MPTFCFLVYLLWYYRIFSIVNLQKLKVYDESSKKSFFPSSMFLPFGMGMPIYATTVIWKYADLSGFTDSPIESTFAPGRTETEQDPMVHPHPTPQRPPCPLPAFCLWKNFSQRISLIREVRKCRNKRKQSKETK